MGNRTIEQAELGSSSNTAQTINAKDNAEVQVGDRITNYQTEDRCLAGLRLTDPSDDKDRIERTKGGLVADACKWILDTANFQRWRDDDQSRLLWIEGGAGKGKTMLLCGIINKLKSTTNAGPLSYFFCQGTDAQLNNATAVLRGLIYLLLIQQKSLIPHLKDKYDYAGKQLFEDINAFDALSKIFRKILCDPKLATAYLIVDGLDECVTGLPELLKFITQNSSTSSRVKWIVSSRNWPNIEEFLERAAQKVRLSLESNAESVSNAVSIYIQDKVDRLAQLKGYNTEIRHAVQDYLSENANNTFLWVALICQNLEKISRRKTLSMLKVLPPGLDSLYKRMMDQICSLEDVDDVQLCKGILALLTTIYRPITVTELVSLVESLAHLSNDSESLYEVIGLCGSFLTIREGVIYFVHQSAKEYLTEHAKSEIFPHGHVEGHRTIVSRSLQAMSTTLRRDIYEVQDPGRSIDEVKSIDPDPLNPIRYACVYWIDHLCEIESGHDELGLGDNRAIHVFLKEHFLHWLEALSLIESMSSAVAGIRKLENLLDQNPTNAVETLSIIRDANRFVLYNRSIIEKAPLQVYASALVFSPANSLTRTSFKKEEPLWITTNPIVEDDWSACLQTLKGHSDWVRSVAFSHDYRLLASASSDRSIKIWNAVTGKCEKTLRGHSNCVSSLVFSHNSKHLVSTSSDRSIRFWDIDKGRCVQTLKGHSDYVRSAVFSYNNEHLISASIDRTIRIWNTATGKCIQTLRGHSDWVNAVACSHDSNHRHLASASSDRTIRIWDIDKGNCIRILNGHSDWVNSVIFRHNSTHLASASSDRTVRIWDVAMGTCMQILEGHSSWVNSVIFSHDGKHLASASDDASIRIWDTTGKCRQILQGHSWSVTSLVFSPNNKRLISASNDRTLKIWDTTIGKHTQILEGHGGWVGFIMFSHDGKHLASVSDDQAIRIWNTSTGECMQTLEGHSDSVNSAVFSCCKYLASASSDRTIKIWDVTTGKCIHTLKGHSSWVGSVVFSPNGKYLASASGDQTIRTWDITTGICIWTLNGHDGWVRSIIFSNDNKYIASASSDRTVRVWDTAQGKCIQIFDGHDDWVNSVVFSDDSKHIASTSADRTVRVWDVDMGKCTQILWGHTGLVHAAVFLYDDKHLASTSADRTVKIWDVAIGKCVKTIDVGIPLNKISFDPANSYLLTEIGRIVLGPLSRAGVAPLEPTDTVAGGIREQTWYGYGLSSDLSWITCHGQGVLCLPHEYRVGCSAVSGSTVAIGCESGRVLMLGFTPHKFPPLKIRVNHVAEGMKDRWQAPTSQNFVAGSAQTTAATPARGTTSDSEPECLPAQKREAPATGESDTDNSTPLHLAVPRGEESVVRQPLEDGKVDQNAKDKSSRTALFYAMKDGKRNIALSLARKWNIPDQVVMDNLDNPTEEYKARSLYKAIRRLNKDEIGFLIEIGADMEAKGYGEWPGWMGTALHEAAWFGTPDIIRLMLANGGNKDARDIGGRTPSQRPNWSRTLEISKLLS